MAAAAAPSSRRARGRSGSLDCQQVRRMTPGSRPCSLQPVANQPVRAVKRSWELSVGGCVRRPATSDFQLPTLSGDPRRVVACVRGGCRNNRWWNRSTSEPDKSAPPEVLRCPRQASRPTGIPNHNDRPSTHIIARIFGMSSLVGRFFREFFRPSSA